ncbi:putative transcription factor B3-Domain family [Helianthus annuus]|nr:putative transcription factor B3-Domain family [Helianthus annuus]
MKKIGESLCFSNGWESVVQDIQLGFGDFLVFRLVNKSMFKMIVFGPNGCEKDFPPKIKIHDDDHEDVDDVKVEYDDEDVKDEEEDEFEDEEEEDGEEGYEEVNEEEEDEDEGEDDGDGDGGIDGNDGDPFFMVNISKTHNNMMVKILS